MQEYGCAALRYLATHYDNSVSIAAAGGIAQILSSMRQHPDNAQLQEYDCAALENLALNDDITVSIAKAGGIAQIL